MSPSCSCSSATTSRGWATAAASTPKWGVDLDVSTQEGFYNYFSTPYLIYANKAARESLGQDFRGDGGDISPCFLMDKLFFECGWTATASCSSSARRAPSRR